MALPSPGDRSTAYSGLTTEGNARVHAGHVYNNHTVNNYVPTRSDETLPGPDIYKAFSQAVVEGQVPRVRNFLRMRVNLDETDDSGLTALHRAVLSGHEDVVGILIEAGADVNAMSDGFGTPLCLAALRGAHEVVALLLRWRASASTTTTKLGTALHCCVLSAKSRGETIDALLAAGADVSAQATIDTRWLQAICEWDGSAQRPLRSQEEFDGCIFHETTPTHIAIRTMQSDLLNFLLPMDLESKFKITFLKAEGSTKNTSPRVRNIKKNRFDMTLPPPRHTYLSSSAMACDLSTVRLLIARRVSLQSDADGCDITALMIAAGQGSTEIVRLLLDSGASVNASSRARWTALHYAAASGNNHIVRILCERGASVYCKDFGGRTPLSVAPEYMPPGESYRPLQTLLRANADIDACDDEGLTPLHKILRKEPLNTVALEQFVRAGANTRLMMRDATSVLKLCMSMPEPGPAVTAIGRGLNYGVTSMEIMCDRLNHVLQAYEDLNDREHMLIYLSAQAGYEDVEFLLSLGCDVQVTGLDGSTALHSAVEDDDVVAIEALVLAGASLDVYTGDEAPAPLAAEGTMRDGAGAVETASRAGSPQNVTAAHLVEESNSNEPKTQVSTDPLLPNSLLADSFVAESLFAESLVAESMIAESLAAQSLFEDSLATQPSTESGLPQQPQRTRIRQPPRPTSSVPREGMTDSSGREARPSPTRGWTRPARRDKKNRLFGGSS